MPLGNVRSSLPAMLLCQWEDMMSGDRSDLQILDQT